MNRLIYLFTATLVTSLSANPSFAADPLQGKEKAKAVCQTCHGLDGQATMAGVPNLSGQKEDYIVIQLQAFRTAQRQHAQMSIIAKMLSDADIENVAAWYSGTKTSVQLPD